MKIYKIILIVIFIIICSDSFAQDRCLKKGNILVDAYYGLPYLYSSVLRSTYQKPNNASSVHNNNQVGGKVEIMLTDKIGVGVEGTYAAANISYLDSNNLRYSAGVNKYRILAKINFHFATTKKLDPYFTLGAGYMNFKYYQTQPGVNNLSTNEFVQNMIPVSVRASIGLRYFFTDFMGLNAEIGLGGPLLQGGLSFKF
jgi:outer membrane protein W